MVCHRLCVLRRTSWGHFRGGNVMNACDFRHRPLSRRYFLKTSTLTAVGLSFPLVSVKSRAASLKPVSVTLDWVYQGANAGFMIAYAHGFYHDAGLDVSISAGKGSASTA